MREFYNQLENLFPDLIKKIKGMSKLEFDSVLSYMGEDLASRLIKGANVIEEKNGKLICSGCEYEFRGDESNWSYCNGCFEGLTQNEYPSGSSSFSYYGSDCLAEAEELLEEAFIKIHN